LVSRRLVVRAKDVVFVKGVVEAHDGLAHVFAERGGDLTIAAPADRQAELDELVRDLAAQLGGIVADASPASPASPASEDAGSNDGKGHA
jgi:hypothetical protein